MRTLWWLICFHRPLRTKEPRCFSSVQNVCVFCPTPSGLKINPVWSCAFQLKPCSCFPNGNRKRPLVAPLSEKIVFTKPLRLNLCISLILILFSPLWCLCLGSCLMNNTTSITKVDSQLPSNLSLTHYCSVIVEQVVNHINKGESGPTAVLEHW